MTSSGCNGDTTELVWSALPGELAPLAGPDRPNCIGTHTASPIASAPGVPVPAGPTKLNRRARGEPGRVSAGSPRAGRTDQSASARTWRARSRQRRESSARPNRPVCVGAHMASPVASAPGVLGPACQATLMPCASGWWAKRRSSLVGHPRKFGQLHAACCPPLRDAPVKSASERRNLP